MVAVADSLGAVTPLRRPGLDQVVVVAFFLRILAGYTVTVLLSCAPSTLSKRRHRRRSPDTHGQGGAHVVGPYRLVDVLVRRRRRQPRWVAQRSK